MFSVNAVNALYPALDIDIGDKYARFFNNFFFMFSIKASLSGLLSASAVSIS